MRLPMPMHRNKLAAMRMQTQRRQKLEQEIQQVLQRVVDSLCTRRRRDVSPVATPEVLLQRRMRQA
tara:strand:+ start:149 stop:346 length:198 start_codon:yes stop_codon:yes gene_type:complete